MLALDAEVAELDTAIEERFRQHHTAEIIMSLPGFGPKLGAEFLAATGGDMDAFTSVDPLAGFAGLAPQPRDSGRINGDLRRRKRYHRGLLRAMYLSAQVSISTSPDRGPSTYEAQFTALRYFALDGTDHGSHREQAIMIRRYIIWRNKHAGENGYARSSTRQT
ncbi:transposase [Rhodococcus zopfii]